MALAIRYDTPLFFKDCLMLFNLLLIISSLMLLSACTTMQTEVQGVKSVVEKPLNAVSFALWKQQFIQRAIQSGLSTDIVHRLMDNAQENSKVVASDRKQAEFVKMPWAYVDSAVSNSRIQNGRAKYRANANFLNQVEAQTGVPASIITAIWGIETSYGAATGNASLVNSLSTLAYEGRRREFAEQQLLALMQLLQRGDVPWQPLTGSWAGGMGQTQFIPGTWLQYGVDGNGDGQRDPWSKEDALASTANYLAKSGWQAGLPWGYEVRLPENFDYAHLGEKLPLAQWQQLGVQALNGQFIANADAELWLPAGARGPALLLTKNFNVIKVYNNSSSYALAVSLLADNIAGRGGLQTAWPRDEQPLSTEQVKILQQRLTAEGYDTQGSDGILGSNTRKAFQAWQTAQGKIADGFISLSTAAELLQ